MFDFSVFKGKNVFITGHTGFKGTWLSRILIKFGAKVTGYALAPLDGDNFFYSSQNEKNMESIIGDIRDRKRFEKIFCGSDPDYVFHMAAQPLVRESYNNPVETYEVNVMGTVHLLEAIRFLDKEVSVVNVTTDKVYKNNEWLWGYRESDRLCGHDPYSNSKSCSELVTYSYKNSFWQGCNKITISTARSGNVIGGGDNSKDRIIPDCIRFSKNSRPIIVRNPNSVRPYQHVLDCLYGYLLLAAKQKIDLELGGSYNFGPDEKDCVTTGYLVNKFCEFWGNTDWENQNDAGPHEAGLLKLDSTLARKKLGWFPKWNIDKAIMKTVDYEKKILLGETVSNIIENQVNEYFENGSKGE